MWREIINVLGAHAFLVNLFKLVGEHRIDQRVFHDFKR
jgi:hypothetical protein